MMLQMEIEGFLNRHGMKPTAFGRQAFKDPRFVFDLRRGREPGAKTIGRAKKFMLDLDRAAAAATLEKLKKENII